MPTPATDSTIRKGFSIGINMNRNPLAEMPRFSKARMRIITVNRIAPLIKKAFMCLFYHSDKCMAKSLSIQILFSRRRRRYEPSSYSFFTFPFSPSG